MTLTAYLWMAFILLLLISISAIVAMIDMASNERLCQAWDRKLPIDRWWCPNFSDTMGFLIAFTWLYSMVMCVLTAYAIYFDMWR